MSRGPERGREALDRDDEHVGLDALGAAGAD
jgi:hypothetical protein